MTNQSKSSIFSLSGLALCAALSVLSASAFGACDSLDLRCVVEEVQQQQQLLQLAQQQDDCDAAEAKVQQCSSNSNLGLNCSPESCSSLICKSGAAVSRCTVKISAVHSN